jgi:hypothetical protein
MLPCDAQVNARAHDAAAPAERAADLRPSQRAMIAEANRRDVALHDYGVALFESRARAIGLL